MSSMSWKTLILAIVYFIVCGFISYTILSKVNFTTLTANDVIMLLQQFTLWLGGSIAGILGYKWLSKNDIKNKKDLP